jgi:hypothetical protein
MNMAMSTNNPVQAVRRSLYVCRSCRQHLRAGNLSQAAFANPQPRRWISRNHVRKIQEAEEEWRTRAQDIESGRMQSLLTTLEERGYINQIVGYEQYAAEHLHTIA